MYNVHDTLTDNANLLGFKGDDEGPIDKEKTKGAGKAGQIGEQRQQQLDLNPEAFPSL